MTRALLIIAILCGNVEETVTLSLKEEQGGIAGKNVNVWEIDAKGAWKVSRFRLDMEGKEIADSRTDKTGKLSEDKHKDLLDLIAKHKELPARLGKEEPINPHRYTLKLGKAQTILDGCTPRRGSASIKDNILRKAPTEEKEAEPWTRFAAIAEAIVKSCE